MPESEDFKARADEIADAVLSVIAKLAPKLPPDGQPILAVAHAIVERALTGTMPQSFYGLDNLTATGAALARSGVPLGATHFTPSSLDFNAKE